MHHEKISSIENMQACMYLLKRADYEVFSNEKNSKLHLTFICSIVQCTYL